MPDTHVAALRADRFAPVSAAEIADEIWTEVARHQLAAPAPRKMVEPPRPPAPAPVTVAAALPLVELLLLDGAAFTAAAYATLLGRAADDAGTAYFAAELARGRSKVELLGGLQGSAEARGAGRSLPGLRRRYWVRRLYRVPGLGRMARLAGGALRRTGISRHFGPRARPGAIQLVELQSRLAATEAALERGQRALDGRLAEQRGAMEAAVRRTASLQASHDELGRKLTAATAEQMKQVATLAAQAAGFARQLAATEDSAIEALLALSDRLAGQDARLTAMARCVDAQLVADRIDGAAGGLRAAVEGRLTSAEATVARNRQDVADQQRRIGLMLQALRDRAPAAVQAEDDHAMDELYLQFEDRFRGSRADVKARQRAYLPRMRDAGIGRPDRPVLDLGCGRGEWLELLREEGLAARGVDANAAMARMCRDAGLDCAEGDALTHLAAQPDGSLGAVTGFHIVEHLPFKVVVRLLDEALRVLAPDGLVLFETPNPANLLTASRYFYLDPTHRNPLPGEMMAMIAEARGFVDAEVVGMHPMAARFPGNDRALTGALDAIFHGPQDYALIARRA